MKEAGGSVLNMDRLSPALVAFLSNDADPEGTLREHWHRARSAWPTLSLVADAYLSLLTKLLETHADKLQNLDEIDPADLYIASACLEDCPGAYAAFTTNFFAPLESQLVSMGLDEQDIDDLGQSLRVKLFVAEHTEQPRIYKYVGKGRLGGLVQVMVIREALNGRRRSRREVANEDALLEIPAIVADPELASIRQQCTREFRLAFECAIEALSRHQRTLLRLRHIDELSVDEIADLYKVHRTTASRWYSSIRETVSAETKKELREHLSATPSQLESLVRLVDGQIDLSMDRLLRTQESGSASDDSK